MFFAAVISAAILPLSAIDPVLSRTIATRMRELPHVDVEFVPKLSCGKPATFMKSVLMAPLPEARIVAGAVDVLGVYSGVTVCRMRRSHDKETKNIAARYP